MANAPSDQNKMCLLQEIYGISYDISENSVNLMTIEEDFPGVF